MIKRFACHFKPGVLHHCKSQAFVILLYQRTVLPLCNALCLYNSRIIQDYLYPLVLILQLEYRVNVSKFRLLYNMYKKSSSIFLMKLFFLHVSCWELMYFIDVQIGSVDIASMWSKDHDFRLQIFKNKERRTCEGNKRRC